MRLGTTLAALIVMALPLHAAAQAYKCQQANGSISFQGQPCQGGSSGTQIELKGNGPQADSVASRYLTPGNDDASGVG